MGRFRPAFHPLPPPHTRFRVPVLACLAAESNTAPKRSTPVFFSPCRCAPARLLTLEARSPILRLRNSPGHYFRKLPCPPHHRLHRKGQCDSPPSPLRSFALFAPTAELAATSHYLSLNRFVCSRDSQLRADATRQRERRQSRHNARLFTPSGEPPFSRQRVPRTHVGGHIARVSDLKRGSVVTG